MKILCRLFLLLFCLGVCLSLFACDGMTSGPSAPAGDNALTIQTVASGPFSLSPERDSQPRAERILAQYDRVYEEFGVRVTVNYTPQNEFSRQFLRAVRSGAKFADVVQTSAGDLGEFLSAGALLPLDDTDLAAGPALIRDGVPFAFRADAWGVPLPTLSYGAFFNRAILTDAGWDPLELYQQGLWDTDTFSLLCRDAVRREGADQPISALITPTAEYPDLIYASLHAFGAEFVTNGAVSIRSDAAFEGLTWLSDLLLQDVSFSLPAEDETVSDRWAFGDRRTAFLISGTDLLFDSSTDGVADRLGEDLGVLPFPSGTGGKGRTGSAYSVDDLFCALTSAADRELCLQVLPSLFAPLAEETRETADRLLSENYFFTTTESDAYLSALNGIGTDSLIFFDPDRRSAASTYLAQICDRSASVSQVLLRLEEMLAAED